MNIFSAALKSFNPPAAYADAAFNWKWKAIAYFIFLCVIAAAAGALMSAKYVGDFYDNYAAPAMADMDKIEISSSGVKTPDSKPVVLKSKSGKAFAIATPDRLDAAKVVLNRGRQNFHLRKRSARTVHSARLRRSERRNRQTLRNVPEQKRNALCDTPDPLSGDGGVYEHNLYFGDGAGRKNPRADGNAEPRIPQVRENRADCDNPAHAHRPARNGGCRHADARDYLRDNHGSARLAGNPRDVKKRAKLKACLYRIKGVYFRFC